MATTLPPSPCRFCAVMAETRPKALRIPDDLWTAALEKAQAEGRTLTDVVVKALTRYVAR